MGVKDIKSKKEGRWRWAIKIIRRGTRGDGEGRTKTGRELPGVGGGEESGLSGVLTTPTMCQKGFGEWGVGEPQFQMVK